MTFCAASVWFHRAGSSAFAFSSARRRVDVSTSKMPPQQTDGLLDRFDERFGFGAHSKTHWKGESVASDAAS
jgi:hypothetical protein